MKCCDGGREHTRACIDRWVQKQLARNPGPVSAEVSRRVIEVLTEARAQGQLGEQGPDDVPKT